MTTFCDIWAYGVTAWEIFSAGQLPYKDITITNLDQLKAFLEKGRRLNKPLDCHMTIFLISKLLSKPKDKKRFLHFSVVNCWLKRALRPLAKNLIDSIDEVREGASTFGVDLERAVNGALSDKGTKIKYFDEVYKPSSKLAISTYSESKVIFTSHESSKAYKIKIFRKDKYASSKQVIDIKAMEKPKAYENTSYELLEENIV